jgi:2-dehydro-3-deoxyphosphogluconate aldolase/(4S)-4-hydroxy-2-oxoglutarate aldolase
VEAVWLGGVTLIELTMTVPNAIELIRDLKTKYRDLLLGAGTVLDAHKLLQPSKQVPTQKLLPC